jgi:hypothetical protein
MILPDIVNSHKINRRLTETGIDGRHRCPNLQWFKNYPYTITYTYNSRGFRDNEWPRDIKNAIWCVGDSFTVGIGAPLEHTWPYILAQETEIPVINIAIDGASNDLIAMFSNTVRQEITPRAIIHQWSYLHRRLDQWQIKSTEDEDIENFIANIKSTQGIHSLIPKFEPPGNRAKRRLEDEKITDIVYDNEQLDFARDHHHYDIITARKYVQYYKEMLNGIE